MDYFEHGKYRGWMHADLHIKQRSELINMARILIEAGKYDLPVSGNFWKQHRMGRADDNARSEFLKGFIHGIASFREIQKSSIASVA